MNKITQFLASRGITRDDDKWLWIQIAGWLGAITSGTLDVDKIVLNYFNFMVTPMEHRWIVLLCAAIAAFAAHYQTSGLNGDPTKK